MKCLTIALCLLPSALPAIAGPGSPDAMRDGRSLTEVFYAGKVETVYNRFDPRMKQAKSLEEIRDFQQQVANGLGAERQVLDEQVLENQELRVYRRTVRYEKAGQAFRIIWAFNDAGQVAGFVIRPAGQPSAAPTSYSDYETKAPIRLPFNDQWYVFWGGREIEQNYHAASVDQRFAYDFLIRRDGSTHEGDGTQNEQYHCWGEPILAPAAGDVVAAVDGLADNPPGRMDPDNPPGNHVVIDHGQGEYSLLAHFRQGSLEVAAGDAVFAGQRLGECGNSGNSSEPHLHYHLQTAPEYGAGEGLPAYFNDYLADGEPVARGIPVRGQAVRAGGDG